VLSSAVAGAVWLRLGLPTPGCRFREWTGLPCATCGTTRMLRALLAGDLANAILLNPMVFFALVAVGAWSLVASIRALTGRPAWPIAQGPPARRALAAAAALGLAAGWAYQIWRAL
jgi:hypothetical protein